MKQFNAKAMILFFTLSMALFTADIEAKNNALDTSDTFHIYLVRHAEKDTEGYPNSKNPPLTKCGNTRAERLASMLANTAIQTIYSTEYLRTKRTAAPTGDKQNLPITSYNPRELTAFANTLLQKQETVLVVGHSNTTDKLASILSGQKVSQIDESEYDHLFIVSRFGKKASLQRLQQGFVCDE